MLKKRIVQISLILLLCGLNAAVADDSTMWWRGRKDEPEKWAEDTRWNNPANWYALDGRVRIPNDEDIVNLNGGTLDSNVPYPGPNAVDPIIDSENVGMDKAECWNLYVPYWQEEANSTACVLWVTDGVLEVGNDFILGSSDRGGGTFIDDGILEMSGGTVTIGEKLSVGGTGGYFPINNGGKGTINMTGGTITCGTFYIPEGNCADPNGGGTVNLDGGTIYADTFVMNPNDTNGLMYITDGMLLIDGNQISRINGYAEDSNNWISGGEPNWVIQAIYYSVMNTNPEDMDTTRVIARNPELAWSPYPKDDTVRILSGVTLSWLAGTKASDVNGHDVYLGSDEASVRDANVTVQLGVYKGRQTAATYDTAPLSLVKGMPYYWRIDEVNNSPTEIFKGRVWSFTLDDGRAYNPYPSDTSTVDTIEPTLSWMPGTDSNSHDVYFGTDLAAVENADTNDMAIFVGNRDVNNYSPGLLLLGTTYYWRIDEVNTVTIKGHVWSFTTGDYLVAEDFDSYVDKDALRAVWDTDYLANNGAQLFVETDADFVRDGNSMMFTYMNYTDIGGYVGSEAEADIANLEIGTDWTAIGAKALVLYFYGDPCNGTDHQSGYVYSISQDQMYVALEDGSGNIAVKEYDGDMNDLKKEECQQWNIRLQDFNDINNVDLSDVAKVYIGFGGQKTGQSEPGAGEDSGKADTVWFDDIALAASRCVADFGPQVDLSPGCYVDYDDLEILFDGWLAKGYDVQAAESIPYAPCLWYKFDETDGNEAEDSMHPGDPNYTAIYMQDPCDINNYNIDRIWDSDGGYDGNGCIVFGVDCNYAMRVPGYWFWVTEDAEQITISAWVKGIVPVPDVWRTLFHAKQWGTALPYWMIGQWRQDEDFILSLFAVEDAPPGSQDDWMVWEGIEDVTEWTHFAFVKDLYADELIMYVDGMPVAMTTTDPCQHMDGDMVQVFYIGGPADRELIDEYEPPGQNELKYDGSYLDGSAVDDFRIYGVALSHPEILKLAGRESVHVGVVPLFSPGDPYVDDKIDLKDYALIASYWLEVPLWP